MPHHPDEQASRTTADWVRLIDTHLSLSSAGTRDWAVSTKFGMGRVDRAGVPRLLDLHREILATHS